MGKKSKVGKARKDHYYNLAKQQGYRARSAYKLTQLGSKYNLFDNVTFVIDLCAAPGGWMQVARQSVPLAGHVFGVDLFPIRAIKGCTSIQADITTPRCERLLNEALAKVGVVDRKVELVLHDGAPNVGSSWDLDAYNQNDLVLKSLHLATKYLKPKGTFVTKVFRSADYTKLLYVFEQLFTQVTPTKPSSSREVSAEIFVVCKGYKAPAKIATSFFDVAKVFEQLEEATSTIHGEAVNKSDLIAKSLIPSPEKSKLNVGGLKAALEGIAKKNRKGYDDGDDFRKCSARQFFESAMPAHVLVHHHRIEFNRSDQFDVEVYEHPSTTADIKEFLQDLKLLGKNDLRRLLRWRLQYLKSHAMVPPEEKAPKQKVPVPEAERLEQLLQQEAKEKLKMLRKNRRKFKKMEEKMKMALAVFEPESETVFCNSKIAAEMFDAEDSEALIPVHETEEETIARLRQLSDDSESEDDDSEVLVDHEDYMKVLEKELEELHRITSESKALAAFEESYHVSKGKKETRRQRVMKEWAEEMREFSEDIERRARATDREVTLVDSDDEIPEHLKQAPSERAPDAAVSDEEDGAADPNASAEISDEEDDDRSFDGHELSDSELPPIPLSDKKRRHERRVKETARRERMAQKRAAKEAKLLHGLGGKVDADLEAEAEGTKQRSQIKTVSPFMVSQPESFEDIAEIQAIGAQLLQKKSRMDLIDGMYNRYAFEDKRELPSWFKGDDREARLKPTPLTKELTEEYRAKLIEVSARPIRKVAEAKARKRARGDKSDRKKRDKTYAVIGRRGGATHVKPRSGKKSGGHVISVDRRLKADKRGARAVRMRRRGH